MAGVGRYDGETQQFVEAPREAEMRFLQVMRAKVIKEGRVKGASIGYFAENSKNLLEVQKPGMYSKERSVIVQGLSRER